jgi:hypothetical protein
VQCQHCTSLERHYARRILGFGASIRRIDFSSLGAHRVIRSLKTSLQMHFGCSPDLTMLLPMLDLRHPRQNSSPTGFLYACAACSVSEFALREAGRCLVHNPQDRLQLRAQCSRRRLPLLIPQIPSLHISVEHSLRSGCRTSKRSALDCSLGSSGAGSGSACSSTSAVSLLSFLSRANAGLLEFSFRVWWALCSGSGSAFDGFYWSWAVSVSLPSGRNASVCAFECVPLLGGRSHRRMSRIYLPGSSLPILLGRLRLRLLHPSFLLTPQASM